MSTKYLSILSALAEQVTETTGQQVFLNHKSQINMTLPSKEAQYSNLGMKLGRQMMHKDQLKRRRSSVRPNQVSPEQGNPDLKGTGLEGIVIETTEDQQRVMKMIRAMPRPLHIKKSMREMLMKGPIKPSKGLKYRLKNSWNSFKITWREVMFDLQLWGSSLKRIEGHQGAGCVSYFVFLRWLFLLNIVIFLILFWSITFFEIANSSAGYDKDTLGSSNLYDAGVTLAATCSAAYSPNVTHDAFDLILDFVQGTGWMEDTAMFYGFYTSEELGLAASEYNMPLAYFVVTVIVLLLSLIVMVHNTLSNFKETVMAQENANQAMYCNSVFASFDYTLGEEEATYLKQKSIHNALVADLSDQRSERECLQRTVGDKCKLYTIRFFINFLIIILLGGAGAAIYYAQDYSSEFTTSSKVNDYNAFVVLLVEFLPSIVIGLLNGILPLIFDILVLFEGYRPAFVIKISLVRTVFLRLASLAMVVTSLYIQITCSTHTTCLVGTGSCPSIQCWETYVGSAIYKLVLMDLFIDIGITLGVELPRKLITTKCDCGIAKKIGPAVFDIPKNVLDLVYLQSLCWLGFFFAPLIPAIVVVRTIALFYLKKLSALYNTVPPEKPYNASKSNSFFMIILMVAYFMVCIPVGYSLVKLTPSPMCGPFRIYSAPSDIMNVQIDNAADWFQTIWGIVTSAAFISSVIILLCLAIYYCSALNSAHKDLVDLMKEQLVLEGRDKQFLLNRINELTGEGPKKKPPTFPRNNMTVINETSNNTKDIVEQHEINLYGREPSIVASPVSNAPAAPRYSPPKQRKNNDLAPKGREVTPPNIPTPEGSQTQNSYHNYNNSGYNNSGYSNNGYNNDVEMAPPEVPRVTNTQLDDW